MYRLSGGQESSLKLLVKGRGRDLLDASITESDAACLFMDVLRPFELILGRKVEHAPNGFDLRSQVTVAGEDGLWLGFVRVEADEIAEVGVVGEGFPDGNACSLAVIAADKDLRRVHLIRNGLKMTPDFIAHHELFCAVAGTL